MALVPKISLLILDKSVALTCVSPKKELTLACVHVGFFDEDGDDDTDICRTCLCEHPAAINLDLIANISLPYEQKEEQSLAELPMEQAGRARSRAGDFSYARENIKQGVLCTLSAICYLSIHWASSANQLEQRHVFSVSNKHIKKFPKTVPISKSLLSYGNKITNSSLYVFSGGDLGLHWR